MKQVFYSEKVDIYQLPKVNEKLAGEEGVEISIGDLHSNPMKLLFLLFKHGIASGLNEIEYKKLVELYKTEKINKKTFADFNAILKKIQFKKGAFVRLIGDELCDRGRNDHYIYLILELLAAHGVQFEVLVSNHGMEFIKCCEQDKKFNDHLIPMHGNSMNAVQSLIDNKLLTREDVLKFYNTLYKKALRIVSYTLNEEKTEITIFSHAGIGLNTIEAMAKQLEIEYDCSSASKIAATIDAINKKFQEHAEKGSINTLFDPETMRNAYETGRVPDKHPFVQAIWNRDCDDLNRPATLDNGDKINFVRGHDKSDKTKDNIYNLDNDLGKYHFSFFSRNPPENNEGDYTVFYSKKTMPELKKSNTNEKVSEIEEKRQQINTNPSSFFNNEKLDDKFLLSNETLTEFLSYCKVIKPGYGVKFEACKDWQFGVSLKTKKPYIKSNDFYIELNEEGTLSSTQNGKTIATALFIKSLGTVQDAIFNHVVVETKKSLMKDLKSMSGKLMPGEFESIPNSGWEFIKDFRSKNLAITSERTGQYHIELVNDELICHKKTYIKDTNSFNSKQLAGKEALEVILEASKVVQQYLQDKNKNNEIILR